MNFLDGQRGNTVKESQIQHVDKRKKKTGLRDDKRLHFVALHHPYCAKASLQLDVASGQT